MKKLIILLLFIIPLFASNKFPTNQWEWWIESTKNYNLERSLRIKSESINMVLGHIMKDLNINDNTKYHVNFSKTDRKFWTNGCQHKEDTEKMLSVVYWRLIHFWKEINKDGLTNEKIDKIIKEQNKRRKWNMW